MRAGPSLRRAGYHNVILTKEASLNFENIEKEMSNFFISRLSLLETTEITRYEYNDGSTYSVASGVFNDPSDPVSVIFSISKNSKHFFFTITDGDPTKLVQDFAALQQYCENVTELCVEHTVASKNSYLIDNGFTGYILIDATNFHELLADVLEVNNVKVKGIAVIPLTYDELEIKRQSGISALYEHWSTVNKDCVKFSSSKNKQ